MSKKVSMNKKKFKSLNTASAPKMNNFTNDF